VDDADNMNVEGANCLLKTLEEPPVGSVLVLIATSLSKQLPTIRSRCQIVRFQPLPAAAVAELLCAQGIDSAAAKEAATMSDGSLESALAHLDGGLGDFRSVLLHSLKAEVADSVGLAKAISKHINDAGQDTASRRNSFRLVLNAATTFYRQRMYATCGIPAQAEAGESSAATAAGLRDTRIAVTSLECCLETRVNLESNANLPTLIECFADDLGLAGRRAGI
jgi:DNA polymerase-3 subunit delta'